MVSFTGISWKVWRGGSLIYDGLIIIIQTVKDPEQMSDPTREAPCSPESEQFSSSEYSDNRNITIPLALGKQGQLDP